MTFFKHLLFVLLLVGGVVTSAHATDFESGVDAFGQGNYDLALERWLPLAEAGDADAQFNIAVMYRRGLGVAQDYREAVSWYRAAAEQGYPDALFNLGYMYGAGKGVTKNQVAGLMWFHIAAVLGHKRALKNRNSLAADMDPDDIQEAQGRANLRLKKIRARKRDDSPIRAKSKDAFSPSPRF